MRFGTLSLQTFYKTMQDQYYDDFAASLNALVAAVGGLDLSTPTPREKKEFCLDDLGSLLDVA